jgi:hypothetical protein
MSWWHLDMRLIAIKLPKHRIDLRTSLVLATILDELSTCIMQPHSLCSIYRHCGQEEALVSRPNPCKVQAESTLWDLAVRACINPVSFTSNIGRAEHSRPEQSAHDLMRQSADYNVLFRVWLTRDAG